MIATIISFVFIFISLKEGKFMSAGICFLISVICWWIGVSTGNFIVKRENREYISISTYQLFKDNKLLELSSDKINDFFDKYADDEKNKLVKWELKVFEIKNNIAKCYFIDSDNLIENEDIKIRLDFSKNISDEVREGDNIIVSGKIKSYSFFNDRLDLEECRLDSYSDAEIELLERTKKEFEDEKNKLQLELDKQASEKSQPEDSTLPENQSNNYEKWTNDNIVEAIMNSGDFDRNIKFCSNLDGSRIYAHDESFYGKTNMKDAYCLQLTVNVNKKKATDIEFLKKVTFEIIKTINDNSSKINFNINLIRIVFGDFSTNKQGEFISNFCVGINKIKNYFSEPRCSKTYISTITGAIENEEFDYESFYKWIEDNLTIPEDNSILAENISWTTLITQN